MFGTFKQHIDVNLILFCMVYFMFDQTLNVVSDIALFILQLELPEGKFCKQRKSFTFVTKHLKLLMFRRKMSGFMLSLILSRIKGTVIQFIIYIICIIIEVKYSLKNNNSIFLILHNMFY